MKKCFRAPGRVIFLCNESGFCQRKEPARSEDRRAVSFQERGPARRAAPCARDPRSLRALIRSRSRLSGAPPRALTSELQTAASKCKPTGRASLYGVAYRAALKTFTSTTLLLGNFLKSPEEIHIRKPPRKAVRNSE
ncbi:uncharacterized protein GJ701_011926 [Geothlypis trichas]